jgi:hypothetical protein
VAALLDIQPAVVSHGKRRFDAAGLLGLTTRPRAGTPITTRVPVPVIMEVFRRLDNNPLLGHDRVKMALDSLGDRYGHMTVWAMVALYKQAHLTPPRARRPLNPDERPKQVTAPHQVWCADIRYLVKIDGRWLYSVLIFDGYSRAIVWAGCVDRQNFAQLVRKHRHACISARNVRCDTLSEDEYMMSSGLYPTSLTCGHEQPVTETVTACVPSSRWVVWPPPCPPLGSCISYRLSSANPLPCP